MPADLNAERTPRDRLTSFLFRFFGAVLLVLLVVPFYRIVATADSDRIAGDAIDAADVSRTLLLLGTLITLTLGVLASRVIDLSALDRLLEKVGRRLVSIPTLWYAATLALLSGLIALMFSLSVLQGKPNLI